MTHILGRRCYLMKKITQGSSPQLHFKLRAAFSSSDGIHPTITPECNPANHTLKDVGLFYKIDNELSLNSLFRSESLSKEYFEECVTFKGTYIMIRKPALEVINYLKQTNFDQPVNKYVLYGKRGYGVTMTMLNIIHYAHASDWLIVHVPHVLRWLTLKTERVESSVHKGLLDLPAFGSTWLTHFKLQNIEKINKFDLRLQNSYQWNIQEENKKGDSLLSLVDHGIARGKYSCDVIMGLLEEVKLLSKSGKVRSLVVFDDYSVLFHPGRKSSNKKFRYLSPDQVSFLESFRNMARSDWHNGAVVLSCHSERLSPNDMDHLPLNKLSLKGFEFLSPFIPIEVPQLTEREMDGLLEFYRSEKWLLSSEGDSELKTLCAGNMATLKELCGAAY